MNVRRHAVAVLIGAAAVTIAVSSAISNNLFSSLTSAVEDGQFELMQATVESKLENVESRAHSRASMIADLPTVRRLLAARDREGLLAETGPMFTTQHDQFGAAAMQFAVAPATSFLRLNAPESFGEDLSSFRPMIVAVNQDHAPRHGSTLGRAGPSISAVVPVVGPDGTHAGSFEVALDFGPMLDDLNESFALEATLFVLEAPLRTVGTGVDPTVFDDENRVGSHVKFYSTNWQLTRQLVTPTDLAHVEEPVHFSRAAGGVPYGVLLYPIRSPAGDPLAVIAVARDFSSTRAAAGRSLVWQALLALFAIVIVAGFILVVVRGLLLRPLAMVSDRFRDLADGKHEARVTDLEILPDELRELAQHHETLRTKGIPPRDGGPEERS